ncbi:XK-related protein 8-like, partial [Clarias magur]
MKERGLLALVHVMQLGVLLRRLGMLELSLRGTFKGKHTFQNRGTDILKFDLSALYLFKAFSESAPQIVLMTTSIIQMEDFQLFTVLSSSVLLQTFSWLWYSESPKNLDSKVERYMKDHGLLALVHVMQLGVFLRCLGMLELSISSFKCKHTFQNRGTEILSFDLSALYLFKAFSESAPQIVLMTTSIIQMQDFQLFT